MRSHILSCLLAVFVLVGAAFWSPSEVILVEAGQIDFAPLRNQATSAMQLLQASQKRRMASLQTAEF